MISYLYSSFSNVENNFNLIAHTGILSYLYVKLKNEKNFIPILVISQIPLLVFPIFRFSWVFYSLNPMIFTIATLSLIIVMLWKRHSYLFDKHNYIFIFFLATTFFSFIGTINAEQTIRIILYLSFLSFVFLMAFNYLKRDDRGLLLSLYYFLFSSSFVLSILIMTYLYRYGFPFSFDDIYKNKLHLTQYIYDYIKLTGNIHNFSPYILFINIISLSLFINLFLKKNDLTEGIKKLTPYFQTTLLINFVLSYTLLILFITRGALLLMFICQMFLLFFFYRDRMWLNICLIGSFILTIPFLIGNKISLYFFDIYKSFLSLFNMNLMGNHIPNITDNSVSERVQAFEKGLTIMNENLMFGIGMDNYYLVDRTFTSPHNFLIQTISETGVAGALFVAILLYYLIKEVIYRSSALSFSLCFSSLTLFIYITIFGGTLFSSGLFLNGLTIFYMIFLNECLKNSESLKKLSSPHQETLPSHQKLSLNHGNKPHI